MAAQPQRREEPEFEGGTQPVPEYPPDEPGTGRGVAMFIVVLLGLLSLAMPLAWGLGAIATVGQVVGTAGLIILWIVWAIILIAFIWVVRSMWRRAA